MDRNERTRLIDLYGKGYDALLEAWKDAPEASRRWKPSANDWSSHQIIIHCGDSETYGSIRIRLLLAEPSPVIIGYDQDQWVTALGYDDQSSDLALNAISASRANTLQLIERLEDSAWLSVGTHSEQGVYSAEEWLRIYGVHLHDHADQIRSNTALWTAANQNS